jgi:lipopolysaccharide biosynthesis protein
MHQASGLKEAWRTWRRRFKARLPYVRKREHRVLQQKYARLIEAVDGVATPAAQARVNAVHALNPGLSGEVCFFVSFASQPDLKPHVVAHITKLLDAGLAVVLTVNTDLPANTIRVPAHLAQRLSGVLIRENTGFDFGAWAHTFSLCTEAGIDTDQWTRLLLVNDSIVPSSNADHFALMLNRLRASTADLVGLTESLMPQRHVQSYFLALSGSALRSACVQNSLQRVLNFPTKTQVIDVYETRWPGLLQAQGLRIEALFPSLSTDPLSSDDTSLRWAELLQVGFPYLKTRVLDRLSEAQRKRLGF